MRGRTEIKSNKTPFLFLALDLPPPPLYRDAVESNIIPQVPISTVLAKYDGETTREDPTAGLLRRWKITRLPPFLIVYYKRFTSNRFLEEKNPTIVNFPVRGVDMRDCEYLFLVSGVPSRDPQKRRADAINPRAFVRSQQTSTGLCRSPLTTI